MVMQAVPQPPDYGAMLAAPGEQFAAQQNAATNQLNAYGNLADLAASIPYKQAQTQGLGLQNMYRQMMLGYAAQQQQDSMNPPAAPAAPSNLMMGAPGASGAQAPSTPSPSSGTAAPETDALGRDPAAVGAKLDQDLDQGYRVNTGWTPQELQQLHAAQAMDRAGVAFGAPPTANADRVMQQRAARIQSETYSKEQVAQNAHDLADAVGSSPTPWATLDKVPGGTQMANQFATGMGLDPDHPELWTPAQKAALDAHVKQYAQMVSDKTWRYTGDTLEDKDGNLVNSRTKMAPTGDVAQKVSPKEWDELGTEGAKPVSLGGAAPVPQWKVPMGDGYQAKSLDDWRMHMAGVTGRGSYSVPAQQPTTNAATGGNLTGGAGGQPASAGGNIVRTAAPPAQPNPALTPVQITAQRAGAAAPAAPPAPAPAVAAPSGPPLANFIQQAPNAPRWAVDNTVAPPQDGSADTYKTARASLVADANGLASTQQDIVKQQRLVSSLDSSLTGPGSGSVAAVQTWMKNLTGNDYARLVNSNPAARYILEKLTGQESIDQRTKEAKEDGNSSIRFGAQMASIYQKMSANPDMDPRAIRTIAGWDLQQDQYDAHRQQAAGMWLGANKDPTLFPHAYSSAYPLGNAVSSSLPPAATVSGAGPVTKVINGVTYTQQNGKWYQQ